MCILALTVFASGCSPHKTGRVDVSVDVPSEYSSSAHMTSQADTGYRWWEAFEDTRLNDLVDEAFRNNLDIAQAFSRLEQARAAAGITGAARWPVLSASGSAGRTASGPQASDSYKLSAAVGYELDLWKKLSSRARAARLDAAATEEQLKAIYMSVSAELAEMYYMTIEQRAQIRLTDLTIESLKSTLNMVNMRYGSGTVPALDVYQSRQNLASASAQRPVFESNLAVTLNGLSVLLGRFPTSETGGEEADLPVPPDFPVGIPSDLMAERPDIRAALMRVRAGDERVAAAVADRFPSFNLVGSYGGSSDQLKSVLESPNILWNLLVEVSMPIIDGGRRKAEALRTKASLEESVIAYHQTILRAFREVNDAISRNTSSKKRIGLLQDVVSTSDDTLRLTLKRYSQGLIDYLPVLNAQQRLFDSKRALLSARRQLISDRIQLARALGGAWVDEEIEKHIRNDY
jgi:NodT family efflux transporter outer membrane factor (OMF) lipoprotein